MHTRPSMSASRIPCWTPLTELDKNKCLLASETFQHAAGTDSLELQLQCSEAVMTVHGSQKGFGKKGDTQKNKTKSGITATLS